MDTRAHQRLKVELSNYNGELLELEEQIKKEREIRKEMRL